MTEFHLTVDLLGLHNPVEVKQLKKEKVKFISCGEEHTALLTEVCLSVCTLYCVGTQCIQNNGAVLI